MEPNELNCNISTQSEFQFLMSCCSRSSTVFWPGKLFPHDLTHSVPVTYYYDPNILSAGPGLYIYMSNILKAGELLE